MNVYLFPIFLSRLHLQETQSVFLSCIAQRKLHFFDKFLSRQNTTCLKSMELFYSSAMVLPQNSWNCQWIQLLSAKGHASWTWSVYIHFNPQVTLKALQICMGFDLLKTRMGFLAGILFLFRWTHSSFWNSSLTHFIFLLLFYKTSQFLFYENWIIVQIFKHMCSEIRAPQLITIIIIIVTI